MKKFLCSFVVLCVAVLCVGTAFAADDDEIRVGVLRFQSGVADVPSGQAEVIGDIFTRMFATAENINVIAPGQLEQIANENKIGISSGYISPKTAKQVGELADCKYIVIGTVTEFKKKSSTSGLWFVGSNKEEANAAADLVVIDLDSGEEVASISETGRAAQSGSFVSFYGVSSGKADLTGMEAGAVSELSAKLAMKARDAVGDPVTVKSVSGKQVTLNVGTTCGAAKGSLYKIYTNSGTKEQVIAVVKVSDAKMETSTAAIADKTSGNLSLVRTGDKIALINNDELKDLVKRKAFAKSRPKDGSSTNDDIDDLLNSSSKTKSKSTRKK